MTRPDKILIGVLCFDAIVLGVAGYVTAVRYGWLPNPAESAECQGAPPVVEFHQGMTLCPGQSATIHIEIPIPFTRADGSDI